MPAIIEQKVTGQEAFAGFRRLVHRYGERAPGPGVERKLWVQPSADTLRQIPSWEWLRMHIDPARSRAIVTVAGSPTASSARSRSATRRPTAGCAPSPASGCGPAPRSASASHGDPDAVSFGDYHVAKDVGWALTGTPFDDAELEEFLEPWRPQRGRVPALVGMAGLRRPRHGPRMAPRTHLPVHVAASARRRVGSATGRSSYCDNRQTPTEEHHEVPDARHPRPRPATRATTT